MRNVLSLTVEFCIYGHNFWVIILNCLIYKTDRN